MTSHIMFLAGLCFLESAASAQQTNASRPVSAGQIPNAPVTNDASTQGTPSSGLGEIVVTATKSGATQLQRTPLAISAFSASQLAQSGISNVKDLVQYAPNLNLSQNSVNAEIYIRGVGSNNVYAGSDPDVTVQVDGVYIARPSAQFGDYLDVERLEVLRGPQGTLYGRNAAGGTINVISRTPTDRFTAEEQLTLGNYALVHEQGLISGPLVTGLAQASLSIDYVRHNGYIENRVPGAANSGNANHGTARGQLRLEPMAGVVATTRADWLEAFEHIQHNSHILAPVTSNGGAPIANSTIGHYFEEALNTPQEVRTRTGGISEDIEYTITPRLSIKSITAYRLDHYHGSLDSDATELSTSVGRVLAERENQFSQEINLSGKAGILGFVTGLYYFREHDANRIVADSLTSERGTSPRIVTNSKAVFAQATAHIFPTVGLTAGVRYTDETKSLDQVAIGSVLATGAVSPGFPFESTNHRRDTAVTPKFGIDWQITPSILAYVSATRGYKSGGFNYAATNVAAESFGPENLWSYEAGLKSEFFDRHLRLNLAGFHYDYKNLQVQSLLAVGISSIANAASATVNGAEAELTAKPFGGLEITANLAYLDATYGAFTRDSVPSALGPFLVGQTRYNARTATYDATGNRLNDAPRFSGLFAAQYTWPLGAGSDRSLFGRAEISFKSRQFYDPSNAEIMSQRGYRLVNLYVGYTSKTSGVGLRAFVKNAFDKGYIIGAAAQGLTPTGFVGEPRTFGLTLTKTW